jgi:hypothetical protein
MFFKTAFAFAIVSALSASLLALLSGMVGLSIYWALVQFSAVPAVSHFRVSVLILVVLAIFVASFPVEFVYARRKLLSRAKEPNLKPAFLLFPALVAIAICSRVCDWLDLQKKTVPRM